MRTRSYSTLWQRLADVNYRRAFAPAQFKRLVPFQISSLRKQRGWSQDELAKRSGLTQGVISRAEDSDYGNLTVNTILKIANGLDVVFIGKFVPYSQFEEWLDSLSEKTHVPDFQTEQAEIKRQSLSMSSGRIRQGGNISRLVEAQQGKSSTTIDMQPTKGMMGNDQASDRTFVSAARG